MDIVLDGEYKGKDITVKGEKLQIATGFFKSVILNSDNLKSYERTAPERFLLTVYYQDGKFSLLRGNEKTYPQMLKILSDIPEKTVDMVTPLDPASPMLIPTNISEPSFLQVIPENQRKNNDCILCGKKVGLMTRIALADGYLCPACLGKIIEGYGNEVSTVLKSTSILQLRGFAERIQNEMKEKQHERESFTPTKIANKRVLIDETNNLVKLAPKLRNFTKYKDDDFEIYRYDQIVNYELIEDGGNVASGGIGRAILGGLAFGESGAIVGAATAKKSSTCKVLQIRISIAGELRTSLVMDFMPMETKKSDLIYRDAFKEAQSTLAALDSITHNVLPIEKAQNDSFDATEELRKYKSLLDDGIITLEEFDAKKKQLLDL